MGAPELLPRVEDAGGPEVALLVVPTLTPGVVMLPGVLNMIMRMKTGSKIGGSNTSPTTTATVFVHHRKSHVEQPQAVELAPLEELREDRRTFPSRSVEVCTRYSGSCQECVVLRFKLVFE